MSTTLAEVSMMKARLHQGSGKDRTMTITMQHAVRAVMSGAKFQINNKYQSRSVF